MTDSGSIEREAVSLLTSIWGMVESDARELLRSAGGSVDLALDAWLEAGEQLGPALASRRSNPPRRAPRNRSTMGSGTPPIPAAGAISHYLPDVWSLEGVDERQAVLLLDGPALHPIRDDSPKVPITRLVVGERKRVAVDVGHLVPIRRRDDVRAGLA